MIPAGDPPLRQPAPLTALQKRIVLWLALFIALTRLLAVSHSMFDWDEALFSSGVRDYNVAQHHPHPPGYPLFVAAAKIVHLTGVSEFRSLQVVVFAGACLIFPLLVLLAREIGFEFVIAVSGAAIFSFLPNVWAYSGTGFSDIPATALGIAAAALLLRGRTSARAYLLGAIVLGIAAGFRPTNLLIGLAPALLATWYRIRVSWRVVALAIVAGGAIAAGSYAGAALASESPQHYLDAVRGQSRWVHDIDSWHNPNRPPLRVAAHVFLIRPVDTSLMRLLSDCAAFGVVAAVVRRRWQWILTGFIFAPIAFFSVLNLDIGTPSRYAVAYVALHALLAAEAFGALGAAVAWMLSFVRRRTGRMRPGESDAAGTKARVLIPSVLSAGFVIVVAQWTLPALAIQRERDSPPAAALEWIRRNVPETTPVYVHGGLGPITDFLLHDRPNLHFYTPGDEQWMRVGDAWILDLGPSERGYNFAWPHEQLWRIIRPRNFEVSLTRAATKTEFGAGWYAEEGSGNERFHWMGRQGEVMLPALRGKGVLKIRMSAPVDALAAPPIIEVRACGALLDRFSAPPAALEKSWVVTPNGQPCDVWITTSATVHPSASGRSSDTRELGLRVDRLSWTPLP